MDCNWILGGAIMKYAIFDEQGFPKAFYDKAIHGNKIPKKAIEITDEQWLEFINNQGKRKWDFEKKEVVEYVPPPPSLEELRAIVDNERKRKIANLLSQTDYVIIKLQEVKVLDDEAKYQELLEQYNSVLEQRKQIRAWNDDVKKRIQEATTREELEKIRQEITSYEPA